MKETPKKPPFTSTQYDMLRRRRMDPKNYKVLKETYTSLYLRDLRSGAVKISYKHN